MDQAGTFSMARSGLTSHLGRRHIWSVRFRSHVLLNMNSMSTYTRTLTLRCAEDAAVDSQHHWWRKSFDWLWTDGAAGEDICWDGWWMSECPRYLNVFWPHGCSCLLGEVCRLWRIASMPLRQQASKKVELMCSFSVGPSFFVLGVSSVVSELSVLGFCFVF